MTHIELIIALAEELRGLLKRVKLPVEYAAAAAAEDFISVNVFEQFLPKDLFDETTYYPLVLVEWLSTQDKLEDESTAQVGLTIGTYAKEKDNWIDAFYLMELIRQHLLRKRLIARKFRLVEEINWQVPSEQPAPFFFIMCELSYNIFQPEEEVHLPKYIQ